MRGCARVVDVYGGGCFAGCHGGHAAGHEAGRFVQQAGGAFFVGFVLGVALGMREDPELVEEVAHDGAQGCADDGAGDKGGGGAGEVQDVDAKEHTGGFNADADGVDDAELYRFAHLVAGALFAEGPEAVHDPREDGGDDAGDNLCLTVAVSKDGVHERPGDSGVDDEGEAADGEELEELAPYAVPQRVDSFG